MNLQWTGFIKYTLLVLLTYNQNYYTSLSCTTPFDGFGIFLGRIGDIHNEPFLQSLVDKLYFGLNLRHFRISYEPFFSPSPGIYNIHWSNYTAWNYILKTLSNTSHYPEPIHIFSSIWSPPHYMKDHDQSVRLLPEFEQDFYYFIKNITNLIETEYNGLKIEAVSPVNEPDNIFAEWDHCNMNAIQLCSMVAKFNDSLISLCPETSYFWITQLYTNFGPNNSSTGCKTACKIIATHAYALNINSSSPNAFKAYYDLVPYNGSTLENKTIWQTEVSSTYEDAEHNQMEEALDLATNIINFVGTTCVERFYYWLSWTNVATGESLMWILNGTNVYLPKKYFVYGHFSNASYTSKKIAKKKGIIVDICNSNDFITVTTFEALKVTCLKFDEFHTVFVNREIDNQLLNDTSINCNCGLCCTTEFADYSCDFNRYVLPPNSVCSCNGGNCVY